MSCNLSYGLFGHGLDLGFAVSRFGCAFPAYNSTLHTLYVPRHTTLYNSHPLSNSNPSSSASQSCNVSSPVSPGNTPLVIQFCITTLSHFTQSARSRASSKSECHAARGRGGYLFSPGWPCGPVSQRVGRPRSNLYFIAELTGEMASSVRRRPSARRWRVRIRFSVCEGAG